VWNSNALYLLPPLSALPHSLRPILSQSLGHPYTFPQQQKAV